MARPLVDDDDIAEKHVANPKPRLEIPFRSGTSHDTPLTPPVTTDPQGLTYLRRKRFPSLVHLTEHLFASPFPLSCIYNQS